MNTVTIRQVLGIAFMGWLSVGLGTAAGQSVPRIPRPLRLAQAPVPPAAPIAPVAPFPPVAPAPLAVPTPFGDLNFDFDFNFDPPHFDVDWPPNIDLNLDLDAIRESARAAVESAHAFGPFGPFDFSFSSQAGAQARNQEAQADALYRQARNSIDQARYERALDQLNRLVSLTTSRVDAGLYWKSYTLARQGQRADALATLADLQKRFADSRWLRDAKALEVEIRQASGQAVSPDAQNDEELKLLALRGLMQSDPDRAVPMIEKLLAGNSSVKLQENALFVLSQSRSARARDIITTVARTGNPDLQLRAIRYLGAMGGPENRQVLDEIYRGSTDTALKRQILRGLNNANDRARLLALAKTETSPELRAQAVQQMGAIHADAELWELYQSESSADVKRRILQGMGASGNTDRLIEVARAEKDLQLRGAAIRGLGAAGGAKNGELLRSLYTPETPIEVRREILNALTAHDNAAVLVELARAEKDPAMKRDIVQKLSSMKSKEATDYLFELLK